MSCGSIPGRCACIPQDVWSEADVTKTQRTLSVWFKTVRRSSFLFKACKRLQENKDNCKITNKNKISLSPMLHLFCFLYHFQGIQPESGQKTKNPALRTAAQANTYVRTGCQEKKWKCRQKDSNRLFYTIAPKTETPAMRSQTLTKSHAAKTSFAPMRHFPESLSAE